MVSLCAFACVRMSVRHCAAVVDLSHAAGGLILQWLGHLGPWPVASHFAAERLLGEMRMQISTTFSSVDSIMGFTLFCF